MPRVKVTGLCLRPRRNNPTGHSENTGNVHEWMKSSSRVGSLNQERLRDKDEPGRIRTCDGPFFETVAKPAASGSNSAACRVSRAHS